MSEKMGMTSSASFAEFKALMAARPSSVILLEGRREVSDADMAEMTDFAAWLAVEFPFARFRSGNAPGTDTAFAAGIAAVDVKRLEYVLPVGNHRKALRGEGARSVSVDALPEADELELARHTIAASPKSSSMIAARSKVPKLRAKARYLIRDTLKVTGLGDDIPKAGFGIFFAAPDDPMRGGTGHTIRVCQNRGVPFALQNEWRRWRG